MDGKKLLDTPGVTNNHLVDSNFTHSAYRSSIHMSKPITQDSNRNISSLTFTDKFTFNVPCFYLRQLYEMMSDKFSFNVPIYKTLTSDIRKQYFE